MTKSPLSAHLILATLTPSESRWWSPVRLPMLSLVIFEPSLKIQFDPLWLRRATLR